MPRSCAVEFTMSAWDHGMRRARYKSTLILLLLVLCAHGHASDLEVSVRGVSDELRENVLAHLGPVRLGRRDELSERTRREIAANGTERVREALRPFGYYAPRVDASVITDVDGTHRLDLRIDPGAPVIVDSVEVSVIGEGATRDRLVRWRDNWPLPVGSVLNQVTWSEYKQRGIEQAEFAGFLAAGFAEQEIAIDLETNTVALRLVLDTGARFVFGNIVFGEHVLNPGIVESIPRFETGDYYTKELMDRFRVDLQATGWFTDVDVTEFENETTSPPSVDLRVNLATDFRNRYQGAFGYGTDTGVRLQANFSRHPVSARGDRLDVGIGWREVDNELALRGTYRLPRLNRRRQYWVVEGTLKFENRDLEVKRSDEDEDFIRLANGNIDERHLRFGRLKVRNRSGGEQQIFTQPFVQFLNSRSEYAADPEIVGVTFEDGIDTVVQGTINTGSVGLDVRIVDVTGRGWETRGGRDVLWAFTSVFNEADNSNFTQLYASTRRVYNVGERVKFNLRGEIGYTDAEVNEVILDVDSVPIELSVTKLPNFYRFRAGGSQSGRGYAFEQLSNNNIGSNNIVTASVETEFRFRENWSVAAFVDAGNAFNDWSAPEIKVGIGAGIRWYSILGPIRLDIAQATDFNGQPWRIHFTVGTPLL